METTNAYQRITAAQRSMESWVIQQIVKCNQRGEGLKPRIGTWTRRVHNAIDRLEKHGVIRFRRGNTPRSWNRSGWWMK